MKTQLDSLTAFFMQNVPERAGRGFDSQIDGMKVISAARDMGNGQYRLSVLRYTALLSWERFPFRLVDPQLLVALLEVWMDEHAAPVLEETGIENTEADWDVTLEDEETATVVLSIPLADELVSYTRTFYNGLWTAWVQNIDSTGGKVAWLEGATYYKTSPAGWYGAGAFANQYVNNAAPFLMPSGYASPKDVSNYLPIVKGLVSTEGYGYGAAVSFGALVSGGASYPSAVINVACESGQGGAWIFDPVTRGFSSDGPIATNDQVLAGTNVVATMGVYESGGNVRVYSPNNPPDTRYPVQDGVSYVGIASGNEGMPYMRARASGSLIYLARQDWVQTYFLQKGEAEARYNLANTAWKAPVGWEKDSTTGMITQWGVATRAAAGTRINFPIAFPTECVSVQLTLIWQGGFHDRNMYVQPVDNTGFNYVSQTDEVSAYFLAKGY